ncbi:hypothetical protein Bbelb_383150 [Branchiostoma belcheri]|nr:hypothetical protein Bbelb_383150 [Branchiostoma belcheri]
MPLRWEKLRSTFDRCVFDTCRPKWQWARPFAGCRFDDLIGQSSAGPDVGGSCRHGDEDGAFHLAFRRDVTPLLRAGRGDVCGALKGGCMYRCPRRESTKIASRYIRAAILDIVGNVRYRRREGSVAPRLPKRDRKLSDHNRKAYRAFPTAVADIPDYIQNGGADVPTSYFSTFPSRCGIFRPI